MTASQTNKKKTSPYQGLARKAFWKASVAKKEPEQFEGIYSPRIEITAETKVATAGSCFAQHIARHLKGRGVPVMDLEPAPPGLVGPEAHTYGFGLYSARFGNIYYARQLLQLLRESRNQFTPSDPIWEKQGQYFDALRPSVEPLGLPNTEDVQKLRAKHLEAVHKMFATCDIFIFTLGLTEAWVDRMTGTCYPTAPGTIAGQFDPQTVEFRNFGFSDVLEDLKDFRSELLDLNPNVKILLTVSPVSLAATASGSHVLPSTVYSKSVLRAAAGQMLHEFDNVDYFPSYEIVTSAAAKGRFFDETYRDVTPEGVSAAMGHFLKAFPDLPVGAKVAQAPQEEDYAAICEELLLEAFSE